MLNSLLTLAIIGVIAVIVVVALGGNYLAHHVRIM
jgi:hypothetical protein